MTTQRFTTSGVLFSSPLSPIKGVTKEGKALPLSSNSSFNGGDKKGNREYKPTTSSYPNFISFYNSFLHGHALEMQTLTEEQRTKFYERLKEVFFAWMCAARREGLTTSKETKRLKFFEFAKNELDAQLHGFGLFTQEFLHFALPPFADENQLVVPDADCSWMVENTSPAVKSSSSNVAYWQPSTSGVPIPTLQETLDLIAEQQAFIEGFVSSQPIPDSDF